MKERIELLRDKIEHHKKCYYEMNAPEITDPQYDAIFRKLLELEQEYPEFTDPNSPSQRLGSDIKNMFKRDKHPTTIHSIEMTTSLDDVQPLLQYGSIIAELKYDGVEVNLIYENGSLKKALTRGDGKSGVDITDNIRTIRGLPLHIDREELIEVRGDVYSPLEEFKRLNKGGNTFKTPLFLANSTIKAKRSSEASKRHVKFVALDIPQEKKNNIMQLKKMGFSTPLSMECLNKEEIIAAVDLFSKTEGVPLEGVVFKAPVEKREEIGHSKRDFKWAISYKFDKELYTTTLLGAAWKATSKGRITPVLLVVPLEIKGETIRKITTSISEIETKVFREGDTVLIQIKGAREAIVEEVKEPNSKGQRLTIPEKCPNCNAPLTKRGSFLECINTECFAKTGVAPATIEGFNHSMTMSFSIFELSLDTVRWAAEKNGMKAIREKRGSHSASLYYNGRNQLADLGFLLGQIF
jgi:DNA ligase (NAD+)